MKEILAKIRVLKTKNKNGDIDEDSLANEFVEMKEKYEKEKKRLKQLSEHIDSLQKMIRERKQNFFLIRDFISCLVKRQFSQVSRHGQDNMRSSIEIDHKKKEINFKVSTDTEVVPMEVSSLSGGEKSSLQVSSFSR